MNGKEDFQKRYDSLSPDLKKALFDEEITKKLREIGKKFKIPENSMSDLAKISGKVFLKIISLSELTDELKKKLNIKEETAKKLSQDLNSEIFSEYEELLKTGDKEHPLLFKSQAAEKEFPQKNKALETEESKDKIVKGEENKSDKIINERETIIKKSTEEGSETIPQKPFGENTDGRITKEKIRKEEAKGRREEEKPLQNKPPDTYRETIGNKEETEPSQIVKEKGRIKGIF